MDILCSGPAKHTQISVAGSFRTEHHKVVPAVAIEVGDQRIDCVVTDRAEFRRHSQCETVRRCLLTSWRDELVDASRPWNHIVEKVSAGLVETECGRIVRL